MVDAAGFVVGISEILLGYKCKVGTLMVLMLANVIATIPYTKHVSVAGRHRLTSTFGLLVGPAS